MSKHADLRCECILYCFYARQFRCTKLRYSRNSAYFYFNCTQPMQSRHPWLRCIYFDILSKFAEDGAEFQEHLSFSHKSLPYIKTIQYAQQGCGSMFCPSTLQYENLRMVFVKPRGGQFNILLLLFLCLYIFVKLVIHNLKGNKSRIQNKLMELNSIKSISQLALCLIP